MRIRLREVRESKLLTQVELAKLARLSEATIVRIEAAQHEPRISTIRKLAAALGVEPGELVVRE